MFEALFLGLGIFFVQFIRHTKMLSDLAASTGIHAENQLWKPLPASWFNNSLTKRSGEITERSSPFNAAYGLLPVCSHVSGTIVSGTLMMGLRECFTPQKKKVKNGIFIGR